MTEVGWNQNYRKDDALTVTLVLDILITGEYIAKKGDGLSDKDPLSLVNILFEIVYYFKS